MRPFRSGRVLAALLAASLSVAAGACSSDDEDTGTPDTTTNRGTVAGEGGAPVEGDTEGANTGAGGDGGGGAAVDPGGGENP